MQSIEPPRAPASRSGGGRRDILWLGAVVCVALLAGALMYLRQPTPDETPAVAGRLDFANQRQDAEFTVGKTGRRMNYADVMGLFNALGPDPAGERFAADFRSKPELERIWRTFQRDNDSSAALDGLKSSDKFQEVLGQHLADFWFRNTVTRVLAREPELGELIRHNAVRRLDPQGKGSLALMASWSGADSGTSSTLNGGDEGRFGSRRSGEWTEPAVKAKSRRLRSGGGSAGAGPASGGSADGSGAAGGPNSAGADAHRVTGIGALAQAKSESMKRLLEIVPWVGKLTETQRNGLLTWIDADGLWGACFRLRIQPECEQACQEGGQECRVVSCWQACLDFTDNDVAACVIKGPAQGCPVPPGVIPAGTTGGTTGTTVGTTTSGTTGTTTGTDTATATGTDTGTATSTTTGSTTGTTETTTGTGVETPEPEEEPDPCAAGCGKCIAQPTVCLPSGADCITCKSGQVCECGDCTAESTKTQCAPPPPPATGGCTPPMGGCPAGTKNKPGVTGCCAGGGCALMCDPA